ncbi:antitoxin VapB family protein [Candidatus Woesearchaeota archaeon]|nr:antitoxin VapB family protein [Candidatus Woesearchaeota archaeon]
MGTKNIAITDEAYSLLSRHKLPQMSFSQVIVGHFKKKSHILDFAGAWSAIPKSEFERIAAGIDEARKGISASMGRRIRAP